MDDFSGLLLAKGLTGMIGKGDRSEKVLQAVKRHSGVYFLAFAGCGALISKSVRKCRVIAFRDLGPEAVRRLEVRELPLIVAFDRCGRNIFNEKRA